MHESFLIEGSHGPIQVNAWGDAGFQEKGVRPVVALHGFTGSGLDFVPVIEAMGDGVAWSAIDLPGHGGSYCGERLENYSLEACIENMNTMLERVGVDRFCLLGYSMGGRIALHYASRYPERVERLILISSSPGLADMQARAERCVRDEHLAQSILNAGIPAFCQDWQQLPIIQSQQYIPANIREPMLQRRMCNSARGLVQSLRGVGTGVLPSLWNDLSGIAVNTVLVSGSKDEKFTEIAKAMVEQMPLAEHVIIEGVGHTAHLEAVDAFARGVWQV